MKALYCLIYLTALSLILALPSTGQVPPPVAGYMQGLVTDATTGVPLEGAVVQFFKPGFELHSISVYADSAGTFDIRLDTGIYLARFMALGYQPEWFDDAQRVVDATPLQVLANDTTFADAGLSSLPPLHPVSIRGTVRDTLTGLPLPGSAVAILRPFRGFRWLQMLTHLFGGFPHEKIPTPGLGLLHGVVTLVRADSVGRYEAIVPGAGRYLALAHRPGYIHKFFRDKLTAFDADRIIVQGDTSGIDFELVPNPGGPNTLAGLVKDSSGAGIPAHVTLMRLTAGGPRPVRFTMTDAIGRYAFDQLLAGKFFVRAHPVYAFAPAWHSIDECGVRSWHTADTVVVAGEVAGIDICVVPVRDDGYCSIAGTVAESEGNVLSVLPSQGSVVYAVSLTDGRVSGFDIVEDDGSFIIDNLPPGSYQISADKEGFSGSVPPDATVGGIANSAFEGMDITMSPVAPVTSVDAPGSIPSRFALRQNYPNPFNPRTEISFELPSMSSVSLKVYNLIGQEINVLTYGTFEPGEYRVTWTGVDGNGEPAGSGVYFVKLMAIPVNGEARFSQVIKIILLK